MKEYLGVSEIAEMFGLNVQTLHYYDRIGLFKPDYRDSRTNYRKYRFDQVYQLAFIRYMRKMGYSIDEMRRFLNERDPDRTIETLKERSRALKEQWKELIRIDEAILRKVNFIERERQRVDTSAVEIRWFPERRYIPIGSEEQIYMEDSFYFYPTIAFYEDKVKYFGAYIDVAADGVRIDQDGLEIPVTGIIPAGKYLVGYHKGPYEEIKSCFDRMRTVYQKLHVAKLITTFNIIDQFVEMNSENYITEVQMQILEE